MLFAYPAAEAVYYDMQVRKGVIRMKKIRTGDADADFLLDKSPNIYTYL